MADIVVSSTTSETLSKLADLLEKASRLARQLSQTEDLTTKQVSMSIPKLQPPKHIPKDQVWFWTEVWQKGEQEANQDMAAGRYETFDGVKDLLANLHAQV